MKKIRWGIVGPGNIANKFAQAMGKVEGAEIVAVAARSEEKGRNFAEKYGIKNVFLGYEAMAQSDIVDAVYIATPHPFHKPCAELYLNAKKHVLCEKPICVNAEQARSLKECANRNNVFLMEAMWTRFLPAISEAKAIIESGEIGEVLSVSADFCYALREEDEPKIFKNELAGGGLLDVGIYGLTFAAIFLGNNPENICSVSKVKNGVDLQTNALLKYENGEIASISCAMVVRKPGSGYIYGTKGHIYMPDFYGANELFVNIDDGEKKHILKPSIGNGFEEEIYEACECIRAGKIESDVHPLSESIAILSQMDYIRKQNGIKYPFDGEDF